MKQKSNNNKRHGVHQEQLAGVCAPVGRGEHQRRLAPGLQVPGKSKHCPRVIEVRIPVNVWSEIVFQCTRSQCFFICGSKRIQASKPECGSTDPKPKKSKTQLKLNTFGLFYRFWSMLLDPWIRK